MAYDDALAARVRRTLAARDDVSERSMFGGLAFMVAGHMCCGVIGEDLMARVGAERVQAALAEPHTRPMDFTGRPLKDYVYVDPAGLRGRALGRWVRDAVAFATSLPPK